MKKFTTVSCRAEGVASVNCENEIGCGKESTLSTMRLGKNWMRRCSISFCERKNRRDDEICFGL